MEQSYHEQLIEQRRHLHQYPEVGWTEFETTWFITQRLQKWGYKVYLGHQVIDKDSIRGRNENWVKEAIDRAKAHQVPEDFSVVGYDDICRKYDLSTMNHSRIEIAHLAVDIIAELSMHSVPHDAVHRKIPGHFIRKSSIGIVNNHNQGG